MGDRRSPIVLFLNDSSFILVIALPLHYGLSSSRLLELLLIIRVTHPVSMLRDKTFIELVDKMEVVDTTLRDTASVFSECIGGDKSYRFVECSG